MRNAALAAVCAVGLVSGVCAFGRTEDRLGVTMRTLRAGKKNDYEGKADYPVFERGGRLAIRAGLDMKRAAQRGLNEFVAGSKEMRRDFPNGSGPFEYEAKVTVTQALPQLISAHYQIYSYTGGAHPNTNFTAYNYGYVSGKPVKIGVKEVFRAGAGRAGLNRLLMGRLRAKKASSITEGIVKTLPEEALNRFVVEEGGITWLFPPYEVASYAEGSFEVKLKWAELRPLLNPAGPIKSPGG